jgi:hypothetical protein
VRAPQWTHQNDTAWQVEYAAAAWVMFAIAAGLARYQIMGIRR